MGVFGKDIGILRVMRGISPKPGEASGQLRLSIAHLPQKHIEQPYMAYTLEWGGIVHSRILFRNALNPIFYTTGEY